MALLSTFIQHSVTVIQVRELWREFWSKLWSILQFYCTVIRRHGWLHLSVFFDIHLSFSKFFIPGLVTFILRCLRGSRTEHLKTISLIPFRDCQFFIWTSLVLHMNFLASVHENPCHENLSSVCHDIFPSSTPRKSTFRLQALLFAPPLPFHHFASGSDKWEDIKQDRKWNIKFPSRMLGLWGRGRALLWDLLYWRLPPWINTIYLTEWSEARPSLCKQWPGESGSRIMWQRWVGGLVLHVNDQEKPSRFLDP